MRNILRRNTNRTRFFCQAFILVAGVLISGLYPRTNAQDSSTSKTSQADADATAKAAERKRRFEESKKALENKNPPAPEPKPQAPPANSTATAKPASQPAAKVVFTIQITMAVGDIQRLYLFDEQRGNVTSDAKWTVQDDSSAADFSAVGGVPTITGKGSGSVLVSGVLDDRSAVALVTIIPRDKMTGDTVRWSQAEVQAHSSLHIVPAVPNFLPRR